MASTIDDELSLLERDIRQLKIEYEQYFGGGKKRPPADIEWRIETTLKRYSDRGANMNFAQRFRYGNLTQMYSKYRDIFRKRMKKKEESSVQRHFGSAAREIEKERARKRTADESHSRPAAHFPFAISCKDPDHEKKKVQQLYTAFRQAKEQSGEAIDGLTPEAFGQFLHQKTEQLKKQKNAHEVEYVVSIDAKHVKLKARVKS